MHVWYYADIMTRPCVLARSTSNMTDEQGESRPLTPRENSLDDYRSIPEGDDETETGFGAVISEPNKKPRGEPKIKKDCTLCICVLVFVSMFILAALATLLALLIGKYETITKEKVPQQLYLPGQTTYNLSINHPDDHSGIEFKVTGSTSRKGIVQFISNPQNESNIEALYNMHSKCKLPTDGTNCTIVRYWPQQMEQLLKSDQSYLKCHSADNNPVQVHWQWISLHPEQNNNGFVSMCPKHIRKTQECLTGDHRILTKEILIDKPDSDTDTVVIQFCTKDVAIVNYTLHFKEEIPNIQSGQHNMYTMDLSVEDSITVPIVGPEQYLYIVTKETETIELTLKYISITTDTQLTDSLYIPQVFYSFLPLVTFVCLLQVLVLLLLCKKVKCARN